MTSNGLKKLGNSKRNNVEQSYCNYVVYVNILQDFLPICLCASGYEYSITSALMTGKQTQNKINTAYNMQVFPDKFHFLAHLKKITNFKNLKF